MLVDAVLVDDVADVLGGEAVGEADHVVVFAMGRRGVDEARAGVVGDVVAGDEGDVVGEEGREVVEGVAELPAPLMEPRKCCGVKLKNFFPSTLLWPRLHDGRPASASAKIRSSPGFRVRRETKLFF